MSQQAQAKEWAPCPHLPPADESLDYRVLRQWGDDRGEGFYRSALTYAQTLWQRGLPARAILALDRALFARLEGDEAILERYPLPYAALAWMLAHVPAGPFVGNPRISYQHLADRVRGPDQAVRSWRAWACWHLCRVVQPQLPGDPRHTVMEPDLEAVRRGLESHGLPGEADLLDHALIAARRYTPRTLAS